MNSLDKYILRQCLTPLATILVVTTILVWMTQALQRIDIIVEFGQGIGVFGYISVLIIPSLLSVIIPFALYGAIVFALHRLHTDSEIAVMFAAGVSRWRIAAPVLLITAIAAAGTYYVNVDLMPRSYRVMKQTVANIRADIASSVIRSGEFSSFGKGLTIYVDDAQPGGQFHGLLVNDYRDKGEPKTYLAEQALIRGTGEGEFLFLVRGSIQTQSAESGETSFIPFEELAIDMSAFRSTRGELVLELTERYPRELLNPDLSKPYDRANVGKLKAEGHSRYASPLYAFAYVLVGLFAMIGGAYSRRGYILRIAIATAGVFGIRVLGYVAQGMVEHSAAYWLLYAIPVLTIILALLALFTSLPTKVSSMLKPRLEEEIA